MPDNDMARRHTLWQRIGAWWRHLGTPKHVSQVGSGGLGTDDATVGGEGSVVVGRNVYGDIYQVYQSAPGRGVLTREAFDRILEAYLHWVKGAHGQTRLWGVEVLNRGHVSAVRDLSTIFVPLTLRRFQPLRREEVEALARNTRDDHLHAYLRLPDERCKAGETMALSSLLSLQERLAIIGGGRAVARAPS
jgi:hypothetical protein